MQHGYAQPRAVGVLLGAAGVTYVGDEVAAVALALAVHGSGASAPVLAALLVAKMLPTVLLAPLSGWAVDRLGPLRALTVASLGGAVVVALLALTDTVALWLLGTALVACCATVAQPALLVLVPRAAGPDAARRALAWVAVANRSSAATGALLAGVLVATGGLRLALLVDAATYLVVVVGVRLAAVRDPEPEPGAVPAVEGRPALAGLRLVRRDPVLRVVLGVLVAAIVPIGISYVAVFSFVPEALGGGTTATTVVVAAYGAGMTAGCWVAGRLPVARLAPVAVQAPLLVGAGFLAPVLVPLVPVAVAGFAVAGLATGTALTSLRGLVVERVPAPLLGRVWAAESALGVSGELLALALAGTLVALAGGQVAMALCGAGALVAGTVGVLLLRRDAGARLLAAVPAPRSSADDLPLPARVV